MALVKLVNASFPPAKPINPSRKFPSINKNPRGTESILKQLQRKKGVWPMSSLHSLLRAFYWLTPLVVWPMSCLYCSMHAFDRPSPCGTDLLISSTWNKRVWPMNDLHCLMPAFHWLTPRAAVLLAAIKRRLANELPALLNACTSLVQFLARWLISNITRDSGQ